MSQGGGISTWTAGLYNLTHKILHTRDHLVPLAMSFTARCTASCLRFVLYTAVAALFCYACAKHNPHTPMEMG